MLYRRVSLPSDEPVQYVGVYVLRWPKEYEPTDAFVVHEPVWSKTWPTEEGKYWFYGRLFKDDKPEMALVDVWKTSNGFAYVTRGMFLYKQETAGMWTSAIVPEPPEVDDASVP